jgi:hypothetical protein
VRWTADSAGPRRTADRGRGSASLVHGARALELAGDGGRGRADRGGAREVVTGDGGVATRRRTGGSERWRIELGRHPRVELGGVGWPEAMRRSGNSRPVWGRGWS